MLQDGSLQEKQRFFEAIKQIGDLPTLPSVVQKIVETCNDPLSTIGDLEKICTTDQALTSKILRLVNSSYFGLPQTVSSVSRAITFLGFNAVKSLALSLSVTNVFQDAGVAAGFDYKRFWIHSIGTAITARHIAKGIFHPSPEEAFITGILHDTGKLIQRRYFAQLYSAIIRSMADESISYWQAEKKHSEFSHSLIGSILLDEWNLPVVVQAAVRYHHETEFAGEYGKIVSVINFADHLCHLWGMSPMEEDYGDSATPEGDELVNKYDLNLETLREKVVAEVKEIQVFFGLKKF